MKNPHCGKHGLVVRQHGEKKQKTFKDTHTHTHRQTLLERVEKEFEGGKKGEDEISECSRLRLEDAWKRKINSMKDTRYRCIIFSDFSYLSIRFPR